MNEIISLLRDIRGLAQMQDVDDVAELHAALMDIDERCDDMLQKLDEQ